MELQTLTDLYFHELKDLYSAEQQLIKALPKMAKAATNEELAAQANVSPFTVSRSLNRWARRGVLSKSRGKVFIKAPEKLLS